MRKETSFAQHLQFLKEWSASNEGPWEKLAALKCRPLADGDNPVVQVLRSPWGRANSAMAARLTSAIEYVDGVDTLRHLLRSDFGRSYPERACELALAGSKINATDAASEDFDPRHARCA